MGAVNAFAHSTRHTTQQEIRQECLHIAVRHDGTGMRSTSTGRNGLSSAETARQPSDTK